MHAVTLPRLLRHSALAAMIGIASAHAAGAAVALQDARGRRIELAAPAQRIVTLAPSITELVYAAGAGSRLIGVARYSDFPVAARALPTIGDASRVDFEHLLRLKPDLVLAWQSGNRVADIERLERLGLRVFAIEPGTLTAIPAALRDIGALAGSAQPAAAAALAFSEAIAALRARYADRTPVRVFYEIWHRPLMTVNARHIITDVLTVCGGRNVFANVGVLTPIVSVEAVLAARPQVVLGGSSSATAPAFALQWRSYRAYEALQNVPALYVNPDEIQRHTPRIAAGARTVCEHLDRAREGAGPHATPN